VTKKKPTPATGLSAADCARRTGLTIRALRVYERAGLLKPARNAKSWRVYGPAELERLNIITALKGFGLTLAQIRRSFGATPPALAAVLDLQLKTWAAKRLAADRAIARIQAATARLRARTNLSVEELCELTRNTEMTNMQAAIRELINRHVTPEQEREWLTYLAERGTAAAMVGEEHQAMYRQHAEEYHALMKRGDAPDSEAVQAVTERSMAVWLKSDQRQRQLEQLAWNPEVTRAWFAVGGKLLARSVVPGDAAEAERLAAFIHAARVASRSANLMRPIVHEALRLREVGTRLGSPEARRLAARYAEVCAELGAGDPAVHARWIAAFAEVPEEVRAGWEYLSHL